MLVMYITRVMPGALAVPDRCRVQSCLLVLLVALWRPVVPSSCAFRVHRSSLTA